MGLLDTILGQLAGNADVQTLAARVGLTPEQVEQALAALAQQHLQPGDTVAGAADQTGLPQGALQQILAHLGGEAALGRVAAMMGERGGLGGVLGGLFGRG